MSNEQRSRWNEKHKTLAELLGRPAAHAEAVSLFMELHGCLYAPGGGLKTAPISFEDELLDGIREQTLRMYPVHTPGSKNSIVWHLWHSARVEDITMNRLVAGSGQVLHEQHYAAKLNGVPHSGNGMNEQEIAEFSAAVNIEALLAYRRAVAERTRDIIANLEPGRFKTKPEPARAGGLIAEGAVLGTEQWLVDYWAGKTVASLLLMPATRHNFVHLNKAGRIKAKLQK